MKAVIALLAVLVLAGCGNEDEERRSQPARKGDPGLAVWAAQGCGSCHTFAPAGATATIGPNLANSLGGRSRAYMRKFGTCRICFRELASNGKLPGVTKSSW